MHALSPLITPDDFSLTVTTHTKEGEQRAKAVAEAIAKAKLAKAKKEAEAASAKKTKTKPKPAVPSSQGESASASADATSLFGLGISATSEATTDLTFNADYASVITNKQKFLEECTAAYKPLVCVDVHDSVVVTMEGSREQLTQLVESVKTHGFMKSSATFAGAFAASSFVGASEIVATGSSTCALCCCLCHCFLFACVGLLW